MAIEITVESMKPSAEASTATTSTQRRARSGQWCPSSAARVMLGGCTPPWPRSAPRGSGPAGRRNASRVVAMLKPLRS